MRGLFLVCARNARNLSGARRVRMAYESDAKRLSRRLRTGHAVAPVLIRPLGDDDLRRERFMHRTLVRDLSEARALFIGQRAVERDSALDPMHVRIGLGLTLDAILRVYALLAQTHRDAL